MENAVEFQKAIREGYTMKGNTILLGKAIWQGEVFADLDICAPLRMMNRHGLISGATGTGKTKTLQMLAENLSASGVPVLLMDLKGDLSGLAMPANPNDKIHERINLMQLNDWLATGFPVEMLSISEEPGTRVRATVTEFGSVLLAKILDLNDTQQSVLAMLFQYCDEQHLPLLDLKDLRKLLQWASNEGRKELSEAYGNISPATVGAMMRKVMELEQQGASLFFGERSFDIYDLMRYDDGGKGIISILRVTDLQERPKMFSTCMLQLLSELYASLPEKGDMEQPELVMFIDEAHLIFKDASKVLIDQLETTIKLIRSKGVGIFFCTQNPTDIPASILSQLGMKIQHALRAFTANDRKAIRLAAANYPESNFYKTEELITSLGIGEALVTLLNEKGIPTPLVYTMICPPRSRMDILTPAEITQLVAQSRIASRYEEVMDRESAYEILHKKIAAATPEVSTGTSKPAAEKTIFDNTIVKSMMRTAGNQIVRSLLGSLGFTGSSKSRKKTWF